MIEHHRHSAPRTRPSISVDRKYPARRSGLGPLGCEASVIPAKAPDIPAQAPVIPAQAGMTGCFLNPATYSRFTHNQRKPLDSRLRGNDRCLSATEIYSALACEWMKLKMKKDKALSELN